MTSFRAKPLLPFHGNKRMWSKDVAEFASFLPRGAHVVDVFGGSGCLSRVIKHARPDLRVTYNDFDGFRTRLTHAHETESLRIALSSIIGGFGSVGHAYAPIKPGCRVHDDVCDLIARHNEKFGYIDAVTVSSWLSPFVRGAFSFGSASIFYPRVSSTPIDVAACDVWLQGLEVISCDAHDLAFDDADVLVMDPPYSDAMCVHYRKNKPCISLAKALYSCHKALLFYDESLFVDDLDGKCFIRDCRSVSPSAYRKEVAFCNWLPNDS